MTDELTIHQGDCIEVMRTLPADSIDAIVTDPPYELGFMNKGWDSAGIAFDPATWAEALRVLKPGGHLAAFGGTRTSHRMTVAIEDAGFEIRDSLMWLYGSGFPKNHDVSKAIDKAAGAEREVLGVKVYPTQPNGRSGLHQGYSPGEMDGTEVNNFVTAPATDAARQWDGWGTALKPAYEPIVLARKPLIGTVAANVLEHGTGALNIDASRIAGSTRPLVVSTDEPLDLEGGANGSYRDGTTVLGRWPANVALDEVAAWILDNEVGDVRSGGNLTGDEPSTPFDMVYGDMSGRAMFSRYEDAGGPSRFFYTAKASRFEREQGLEGLDAAIRTDSESRKDGAPGSDNPRLRVSERKNDHPTVKPLSLMRWLVRMVTPPGGTVLDPFLGSGTTGMAALDAGFEFVGIEKESRYVEIARLRIEHRHLLDEEPTEPSAAHPQGSMF